MMKGALENVEVLHFLSWFRGVILCSWFSLSFSPSPSSSPPAYSHSTGLNDEEECIQRVVGRGEGWEDVGWLGGLGSEDQDRRRGGGYKGNGPPQLNVSDSSIAAG